jgi:hypothetical protein
MAFHDSAGRARLNSVKSSTYGANVEFKYRGENRAFGPLVTPGGILAA